MNEQQRAVVQQEPVAFLHWYDNAHWGNEDFKEGCHRSWDAAIKYATSPAQPAAWVDLTDDEILEAAGIDGADTWMFETAYAIQAKLREKNGGKV